MSCCIPSSLSSNQSLFFRVVDYFFCCFLQCALQILPHLLWVSVNDFRGTSLLSNSL